jgi:hypothetical protein
MEFLKFILNHKYTPLVLAFLLTYMGVVHLKGKEYVWGTVDLILAVGNFVGFLINCLVEDE